MNTQRIQNVGVGLLVAGALFLTGCAKKCQAPPEKAFTTFLEQEWRVTSDSKIGGVKVDNFNFLIFVFHRDFTGEVFEVETNSQSETPSLTFTFNVDPEGKEIILEYNSSGGNQAKESYNYSLGREFELLGTNNNAVPYIRMVPFNGIVDPDRSCEF